MYVHQADLLSLNSISGDGHLIHLECYLTESVRNEHSHCVKLSQSIILLPVNLKQLASECNFLELAARLEQALCADTTQAGSGCVCVCMCGSLDIKRSRCSR